MSEPTQAIAAEVRERFLAGLERLVPELIGIGQELLARIAPEQWTAEWYLPYWVGTGFGLPIAVSKTVVLCNVYGLGYVRLQDDLADGEVTGDGKRQAMALSGALYHLALREYAHLFSPASPFWAYLEKWLGEWWKTMLGDTDPAGIGNLGQRGAPLKIGCAAVSLMAGREDELPLLSSMLDETLAAAVLLDHALDWTGDLAAGRYNALVAAVSGWPQDDAHLEINRITTLEQLWAGRGHGYFELLQSHLRTGRRLAAKAGLPEMEAHVDRLTNEAENCERQMVKVPQERIRALTMTIFGPQPETESL